MDIFNAKLIDQGDACQVTWTDEHVSRFHATWLRMYCSCAECAVPGMALNRRLDPTQLPEILEIKNVSVQNEEVCFEFKNDPDHVTLHPIKFLRDMCYCDACLQETIDKRDVISKNIKNGNKEKKVPVMDYNEILEDSDKGVFKWLKHIVDEGVCVIKNVPALPDMVKEVAEKIAYVDETNYGKIFDVKILNSVNAGYTSEALAFHQDLTQYENAIGFLMLHALKFDDCVIGGESSLLDAFEAAEILKRESPEDFQALVEIPVLFTTIDYERSSPLYPIYLQHQKPHIAVDYFGKVVGVNWSPATTTPLQVLENDVNRYFKAYRKYYEIIKRKKIQYRFKLERGDLLSFNNRRMLHAREAFQPNGGERHLRGLYIKLDEVKSRFVVLAKKLNVQVAPPKMGNNSSF